MQHNLYILRELFSANRNRHGGHMGSQEEVVNALQRNLSLYTDAELREIISACNQLKQMAAEEFDARAIT